MNRVAMIQVAPISSAIPSLIEHNIALLEQGAALFAQMDDALYSASSPYPRNASVGAHLRHCLDFYHSVLDGIRTGIIDHGRRARDPRIERERSRGIEALRHVVECLRECSSDADDSIRLVVDHDGTQLVATTVARELEAAANHTIHHYAVIAVLLRIQCQDVPEDFGVSPSTLRHRGGS